MSPLRSALTWNVLSVSKADKNITVILLWSSAENCQPVNWYVCFKVSKSWHPPGKYFLFFFFFCQVAPVCWERYIFSDELLPYRLKCCIYLVLILSIVKKPVKAHLGATCSPQGSNPAGPFFHLCISCYYGRTAHLALLVLKTDIHEGHKIQYSFTFYKMLGQMNKCCRGNGIIYL